MSKDTKAVGPSGSITPDEKPPSFTKDAPGDKMASAGLAPNLDAAGAELTRMVEAVSNRTMTRTTTPDGKETPISFPRPVVQRQGMPEETLLRNWKQQKRAKCAEPRCYAPLNAKRFEDVNAGEPLVVPMIDGSRGIAAECSWDPRHAGGLQFIPVVEEADEE